MKLSIFPLRQWLNSIPIKDPIERRMASLVQVILLGFMAIIFIAVIVNLIIGTNISWQIILIRSFIIVLIIGFPLILLRRGYFRRSVFIIIAIFFLLETFAITTASLRETADTLLFFTLTIILAGLLLGRRALVMMFILSVSAVLISAILEENAEVRLDSIVIAGNFILLNGLMGLFLDQFGLTLRRALRATLEHEGELQKEIIGRKHIEQNLQRRVAELEALYQSGIAFSQTFSQEEIAEKVIEVLRVNLDWHHAAVRSLSGKTDELELLAFSHSDHFHETETRIRSMVRRTDEGMVGWVIENGHALRVGNLSEDPRYVETYPGMQSGLYVPLKIYNRTFGCINVESEQPDAFSQEDENLLTTLAVQAAVAIENAHLYQKAQAELVERQRAEMEIRRQVERLTALSKIDQAIMSSFDINVTLDILLSQMISQLQVNSADVLLLSPDGRTLKYAAGQGFRTNAIELAHVRVGEGYAGRAAKEHQLIKVDNIAYQPNDPLLTKILAGEDFVCYYGVPLIVKGKAIGVLEVFHREPLKPDSEWLDYLNTLAGQAAIAIENTILFENLEQSNRDLFQAYDATIEGWSRAMDLRDKETEGHTQRVSRMTLELAAAMGVDEAKLIHIRRGALLHDIGKLGVPDRILLKDEKLTDEEWEIMRQHPQFAYEMLSSIRYLQPALPIPYCHHEKWDGSGYPRGLAGEQIPLEARIFAVVDVWDALRSDRPYRPAWNFEKAREYIREQVGIFFDPKIVEFFLQIIK